MTRILFGWLDRLPNWLRAGIVTGTLTAILGSAAAILAWLEAFFEWAAGEPVAFPDLSILRAAAVGIAAGAVLGGFNAIFRWVQEHLGRGNPPIYPSQHRITSDRGQTIGLVPLLLIIIIVLLVIAIF